MLCQGTALTVLFVCFSKRFQALQMNCVGDGEKVPNFMNPEIWLQLEELHPCTSFLIPIYMHMGGPNICSNPERLGPADLLWPPLGSRDNTLWWGPGGKSPEADKSFNTHTHTHTEQKSPSGCTVIEFDAVFLFCLDPQFPISLNKVKISLLFLLSLHTH